MTDTGVSVRLTPNGFLVTCSGTDVVGHGPTETDAWNDFLAASRAQWQPPVRAPGPLLPAKVKHKRTRTLRIRDLFG
ncbi:hypothetical protein [Streptomyces sp. 3211]|uniref:hypothetical protein n=1 Tax=Streptomyces sp. 3211 TaxID=1964449 RepID=UPI00133127BA|nr:hypothetical protein [Streptomyces sp. 3211]